MKKALITCVILSTLYLASCNKKTAQPNPALHSQQTFATITNPDLVGTVHNETLEYVYDSLQVDSSRLDSLTREQIFALTMHLSAKYLAAEGSCGLTESQIINFYTQQMHLTYASASNMYTNQDAVISSLLNNFSGVKKTYVGQIFNAIDSFGTYDSLVVYTDSILAHAQASFSGSSGASDYNEIAAYVSIAQHSWSYWDTNDEIGTWVSFLTPHIQNATYAHRDSRGMHVFRQTVKGDVEWGVSGALTGLGFAGVGALAGAMIGAPVGSAWSAIWSLWD
ncbi:MAG: hypothetical protein JSS82_06115 [Bacteroidetes bacterium]|nr:hypothetical protein [Bacteroidota bacterium]